MKKRMIPYVLAMLACVLIFISSCKKDKDFHQVTAIEKQIHEKLNDYRLEEGLNALVFQPILFREARTHSLRMVNETIEPGYEGLEAVFTDLRAKLGSGDAGAIVELTDFSEALSILNLMKTSASKDSVLLGQFTQAGVGYATDKDNINYITVLFLDIPEK